jgi:hypothetical protein
MSALMKCSGTFMWIFCVGVDALEVDVQHLLAEGVHLVVAQQHRFLLPFDIDGQHGSVEGFLAQAWKSSLWSSVDRLGGLVPAVDDAGTCRRDAGGGSLRCPVLRACLR